MLREVATLLEEGRAVGAKALKDYMEVLGYSEAARWVYSQGIDPGDWTTGELITLTEVRTANRVLMTKVWEVAPHPDATPQESPGNFRTHDLHPFGGGMQPPPHPEVPATITDWIADVASFGAGSRQKTSTPTTFPWGWPPSTASSNASTRSSTATAGLAGCC